MDELYQTNADFRAYVDKYMTKERIDLCTALTHAIVRSYAAYLSERGSGEAQLRNMWGESAGAPHGIM